MSSLGFIYLHAGASTEALEWLTRAAEQGHLISQSNLGYLYRSGGYGVTKNRKESVRWSLLAAKQGDANNQKQVGISYYHGIGVIQDYAEAMKWLRLSAEQGHVESQWVLADMYKTGKGSTSNKTLAHMWFNIAASNGYSPAKEERDRLSETMTSSEVHTAQKLARECVKKGYKDC